MIKETGWMKNRGYLYAGRFNHRTDHRLLLCGEIIRRRFYIPRGSSIKLRFAWHKFAESVSVYFLHDFATIAFHPSTWLERSPSMELTHWLRNNFPTEDCYEVVKLYAGVAYK